MRLMRVQQFNEDYGYSKDALAVNKFNGSKLGEILTSNGYVDLDKYDAMVQYNYNTIETAHAMYYAMVEYFGTERNVARNIAKFTDRSLSSWNTYINSNLFMHKLAKELIPSKMLEEFAIWSSCVFVILTKKGILKKEDWVY